MTNLKRALVATVAGLAVSSAALAAEEGTYVSLGAGVHIPNSSTVNLQVPDTVPIVRVVSPVVV